MRTNNWPAKLTLFIEEKRQQPFDWVLNNCCFFACDWIAILVGKDPAKGYRRRIKSELSACRVLKKEGGAEGIADRICAKQKWPEVQYAFVQRGDVVLLDTEQGPALGVCIGPVVAFSGRGGVAFVSVKKCRKAWRIG